MKNKLLLIYSVTTAFFMLGASSCELQRVIVNEGSGSGYYQAGKVVEIAAREPVDSYERFVAWEGDTDYLEDASLPTTTLTIPELANPEPITVTATYEETEENLYQLSVAFGEGSGRYEEGDHIEISGRADDDNWVFSFWQTSELNLGNAFDPDARVTTIQMPARDVRIEAEYDYFEDPGPDPNPNPNPDPDPNPGPSHPTVPADFSNVQWLHTNVSSWTQTATLSSVNVSGSMIYLPYDKAGVWPKKKVHGTDLNANPWIFIQKSDGSGWYAATWEWMRPGQTAKQRKAVNGDHIKKDPLKRWSPKSGEWYGFMVTGLARDGNRNVRERTNVVMYQWP